MSKIQLKDICSFSKGSQINGDELIENGEYDYLNGGINPSGKWSNFNVSGDTITISEGGNSCGYVNYMPNPFWCGAHCYYLYDLRCNVKYLYYALKSQQDRIMKLRSGACMPNIKKSDIGSFAFEYTEETSIQNIVVSNLDKITRLIDLCNTILEKLDLLVKSRFVEMFNTGEYTTVKLKSVCSKITDGTHKTPNYLPEGITFISAKNIINGELDFSDVKYISETEYNEIQKRCQTEIYDILLSKSGSLGSPTILRTDKPLGLFESLAIIKYDRRIILPEFLCEQLKTDDIQRQFKTGTKGVAIKHLHLNVIGDIDVVVPPLALQEQFAAFVKQTDKSKLAVKQVLEKAEMLKKALMQEYFG